MKKIIVLLLCLISTVFLACSESSKATAGGENTTDDISNTEDTLTLTKLAIMYEGMGLKNGIEDKYKTYDRISLKNEDDTTLVELYAKDKVVQSKIELKVKNGNYNDFKDLASLSIRQLTPDFSNYSEWLDYIINIIKANDSKTYFWDRAGVKVMVSSAAYIDFCKVTFSITNSPDYYELAGGNTDLTKTIELNKDGKLDGTESISVETPNNSKTPELFTKYFTMLEDKEFTDGFTKIMSEGADVELNEPEHGDLGFLVFDKKGSKDKISAIYKTQDSKDLPYLITYFHYNEKDELSSGSIMYTDKGKIYNYSSDIKVKSLKELSELLFN